MGSRGSNFENSIKATKVSEDLNSKIDELISKPSGASAVMNYLKAIDERNKSDVLSLDKKLKEGKLGAGENGEKLASIRKELLKLAKDNPDKVSEIREATMKKISDKAKEQWEKMSPEEKASYVLKRYKGKTFRLKNDVQIGADWSKVGLYYPSGSIEGKVIKVKAIESGGDFEFLGSKYKSEIPKTTHYQFLIETDDGFRKWFSSTDLEPVE